MQLRQSLIRSTSAVLIFGIQILMGLFSIPGRLRGRRLPRDRQFWGAERGIHRRRFGFEAKLANLAAKMGSSSCYQRFVPRAL